MSWKKKRVTEISDVPRDLAPQILSFLPTEKAVRTSYLLLKGAWRDSFKELPRLHFLLEPDGNVSRFKNLVEGVLDGRGDNKLLKFSLSLHEKVRGATITRWIDYALDNRVENLKLTIYEAGADSEDEEEEEEEIEFELSPRVFSQESLVSLKLAGREIGLWDAPVVYLPGLKKLCLDDIVLANNVVFVTLIASCPVLEEVVMTDIEWQGWESCLVTSSSLRILKINWDDNGHMSDVKRSAQSVSFCTPNLVYLEYEDYVAAMYPIVVFDSLVEARINLRRVKREEEENPIVEDDVTLFMMGIDRVERLWLSAKTIKVLQDNCHPIPIFHNLRVLQILSRKKEGWGSLPNLLNNSQNLATLVFHGLFHRTTERCGDVCPCIDTEEPSSLLASPVRVLEIHDDQGEVVQDRDRFEAQVTHFLLKMPNLEQVNIYVRSDKALAALNESAHHLRGLPGRASPNCAIHVLQQLKA